ncbi:membrane-anchored ubiquitin-fold protein 6-like [Rutidosis leptorrhynchoides]|uniref:membrane-anchored ubiquitin-fold protein 6-like n=1 Tax=Rutidosis leptorrhynchoides TaxID=125765 RepID=UPI003A997D84
MAAEELIEVKFRLSDDGTDIGPSKFGPSTTVGSLKEQIISQWPKDKENAPKTINDVKLINAGKILENNKTLAESRSTVSEIPGSAITMHVVVRPPMADKYSEKLQDGSLKTSSCSCTIL